MCVRVYVCVCVYVCVNACSYVWIYAKLYMRLYVYAIKKSPAHQLTVETCKDKYEVYVSKHRVYEWHIYMCIYTLRVWLKDYTNASPV